MNLNQISKVDQEEKQPSHFSCLSVSEKIKISHQHHPLLETPEAQARPAIWILLCITSTEFPLVSGNTSKSIFHSVRRVWHTKSLHKSFGTSPSSAVGISRYLSSKETFVHDARSQLGRAEKMLSLGHSHGLKWGSGFL